MTSFHNIQAALDRILGPVPAGNHGAFWRGKTRDEFVALEVFGLKIIEAGAPERSNLLHALKGLPPFGFDLTPRPPGALLPRMPARRPPASPADIALIEEWIKDGCPERLPTGGAGLAVALGVAVPTDDTHVRYWREIELFFHPVGSSPETEQHVNQFLFPALVPWLQSNVQGGSPAVWQNFMNQAAVKASFEYIRLHQRRLIEEFYGSSQDDLFDSLWKFGGDLLPRDPSSPTLPEHRMNSIQDWFLWVPYVDMSLRSAASTDADNQLARAWQVGIAADGLLRKDSERPQRMPIPEFDENDPNVRDKVVAAYTSAAVSNLISGMQKRGGDFFAA